MYPLQEEVEEEAGSQMKEDVTHSYSKETTPEETQNSGLSLTPGEFVGFLTDEVQTK